MQQLAPTSYRFAGLKGWLCPWDRMVAVIQMYVDESGEKKEAFITMAGFVAPAPIWIAFETSARAFFAQDNIEYLHTMDFADASGQFHGWSRDRRTAWAHSLFAIARDAGVIAVESSVEKTRYREKTNNAGGTLSPLGFAFHMILERLNKDADFMSVLSQPNVDLSVIYESGHKNAANVANHFLKLKKRNKAKHLKLNEFKLADKKDYVSLMIADFVAYYWRRHLTRSPEATRYGDEAAFVADVISGIHQVRFCTMDFNV